MAIAREAAIEAKAMATAMVATAKLLMLILRIVNCNGFNVIQSFE